MLSHASSVRRLELCDSMFPVTSHELLPRFMFFFSRIKADPKTIRWYQTTNWIVQKYFLDSLVFCLLHTWLSISCVALRALGPVSAVLQLCSSLAMLLALPGRTLALAHSTPCWGFWSTLQQLWLCPLLSDTSGWHSTVKPMPVLWSSFSPSSPVHKDQLALPAP